MLLRSSSTPIPRSWVPHTKETQEHESVVSHRIPRRTRSMSLSFPSWSSFFSSDSESSLQKHPENDLKEHSVSRRKSFDQSPSFGLVEVEEPEPELEPTVGVTYSKSYSIHTIFSSSGLDGLVVNEDVGGNVNVKETALTTLSIGGLGGDGGGKIGGGRGGNEDGNSESSMSGNHNMEFYYENMIQANPGESLLLGNYAKFLKEVKYDFAKAEEYCARAILAHPNDGNILSLYADIIWKASKDAPRAESYFYQAVQAAPDDCFVAASYARFLWDTEEEEAEAEEDDGIKDSNNIVQSNFFHGTPLTAAS